MRSHIVRPGHVLFFFFFFFFPSFFCREQILILFSIQNPRRILQSVESRLPQIELAPRCSDVPAREHQRRSHTTSQRFASFAASRRSRDQCASSKRPGPIPARLHRLGSPAQYSTETTEKRDKGRKGSEAVSYGYSNSPKTFGGLLPGKAKYGGLGRLLVEAPLETLHAEFEARGLMSLHTDFVASQSSMICAIECHLTRSGQTVTEYGIDPTAVCRFRSVSFVGSSVLTLS